LPRPHHIGVRLSDEELARLRPAAVAAEISVAALVRRLALSAVGESPGLIAAPPAEPSGAGRLTRTVGTRLSPEQHAAAGERARACGLPLAAYVRRAVLGIAPSARPRRSEVRPALAALNQVGNNLNQLTKLAHQGTVLYGELAAAVERVLGEVRRVRDAVLGVDE